MCGNIGDQISRWEEGLQGRAGTSLHLCNLIDLVDCSFIHWFVG